MQIPNQNGQDRILRNDFGSAEKAKNAKSTPAPHIQKEVGHTTDGQIASLRTQFDGQQLRPDVVAAAKQHLASGELLSRAAAEDTAKAVFGIVKHF